MAVSSGTVSMGKLSVNEDSLQLDQITDVTATGAMHDDVIIYKDSSVDANYVVSGWYSGPLLIENLGNVIADSTPAHNEIMAWNDSATDPAYATGWVNKNISSLFTGLSSTIAGIVGASEAVQKGLRGNIALSDMIMMSDTASTSGPTNVSVGSADNNNELYKRELTDADFVFVQTLSAGGIANLTYTTGTILRSTRGIYGMTGPFPMPLGVSGLSFKNARFATTLASTSVTVASLGTSVTVTLFGADGVTVVDGPIVVEDSAVDTLNCDSTGEFLVSSTGSVVAVVNGNGNELRILPPMSSELICWNRSLTVCCLEGTAAVTYYRRTGATATTSVPSGTPTLLNAGSNADFELNGAVILRSDKPISCYTQDDSAGTQSVPGMPLSTLSQKFSIPSFIDDNADNGVSCIAICSPYEGACEVFDNAGGSVATFNVTRSTSPATTTAEQLFAASGRWQPQDAGTTMDGGYIICTVPCMCAMNFNGSSVWLEDNGRELAIVGTSPREVRAEIKKDASGLLRRRTVSASGVVSWEVC